MLIINNINLNNTIMSIKQKEEYYLDSFEETTGLNRIKRNEKSFEIKDVLIRFIHSYIPLNTKLKLMILDTPDLIGPFFISTLIIILLFILFNNTNNDQKINGFLLFIYILFIVYFILFGLTYLLYFLFTLVGKKISYKYIVSVFGYSLSIFIPILFLHLFLRSSLFSTITFVYGISSSIVFILINHSQLKQTNLKNNALKFLFSYLIEIVLLLLSYQLYLYFFQNKNDNINQNFSNNQKFINYKINNSIIYNNKSINSLNKTLPIIINPPIENKNKNKNQNKTINTSINTTKNITKNIINIASSTNYKYMYPTLVLITSLMENIGPNTFYKIYIMIADDDDKYIITKTLNTLIPKYGNDKLNITFLVIGYSQLPKNASISGHISIESYFRILLPSLLPNLDRIIYMDADVVNFKDLTELYNLELTDDIYLRTVLSNQNHLKEFKAFGIQPYYDFNAGLLLMNLKSFRKYEVDKKLLDFISSHKLKLHDQTALNAICYKNNKLMPPKFNFLAFSTLQRYKAFNNGAGEKYKYSDEELKEALYSPVNLHYANIRGKPWNKYYLPKRSYWWYYANKTNYMEEIMKFANYNRKLVDYHFKNLKKNHILLKDNFK